MRILAHRGLWRQPNEQNTLAAFAQAFDHGFGIETDIRDCQGRLVIAHNPPGGTEPEFKEALALLQGRPLQVALNIKADGLAESIRATCLQLSVAHWFVFDMSVPDMRCHLRIENPVYARMSEVEDIPLWADKIRGIWLDAFVGEWYNAALLGKLLENRHAVCIVSAELHGRTKDDQWAMLSPYADRENLSLCTDLPFEARHYFTQEGQ